jgi:hypothetical protein
LQKGGPQKKQKGAFLRGCLHLLQRQGARPRKRIFLLLHEAGQVVCMKETKLLSKIMQAKVINLRENSAPTEANRYKLYRIANLRLLPGAEIPEANSR